MFWQFDDNELAATSKKPITHQWKFWKYLFPAVFTVVFFVSSLVLIVQDRDQVICSSPGEVLLDIHL